MKRWLLFSALMLVVVAASATWPMVFPEVMAGDQLAWTGEALHRQVAVENAWWGQPDPPSVWMPCRVTASPESLTLRYHGPWTPIVAPWDDDCQCYLLSKHDGDLINFHSFTVTPVEDDFLVTYRLGTLKPTGSIGPWYDFDSTRLSIVGEIIQAPAVKRPGTRRTSKQ